jgi:hypothetical protein
MGKSATAAASAAPTAGIAGALAFTGPLPVPMTVAFDAGRLTSDGGLVWLAEADAALGLCAALAVALRDWRRGPVRHDLVTLVRQRVFQIACGYEDQDDADTLRTDPLLKLVCGRLPESGAALASQPTLSRLENAPNGPACYRLAVALLGVYLRERERVNGGRPPARLLLDLDGTADPTHGHQEGSAYHGYYRQHMYHPLLVFDGDTDQVVTAVLRPGAAHGSQGAVAVLARLVRALRARWPGVRLAVRADSGFAVPALYDWCEAQGIDYTIGLIPNPRLETVAAPLLVEAQRQQAQTGATKVRLAGEVQYQTDSWPVARRVVYKAEALAEGPNTRFVVTTRTEAPLALYDYYVDRGEPEGWIKDLKRACFADRLSCHRFVANQFRLLLHAAAYCLLAALRRWLGQRGVPRQQLDTLRRDLLKIGGWVGEHVVPVAHLTLTRVQLHLAASHPAEPLWRHLAARPTAPRPNPP